MPSEASEVIANQSPASDHAHAAGGSSVNQIRFADKSNSSLLWHFVLGALVAGNLVFSIFLYEKWRDAAVEDRLKQYNLDWFKSHEFSDLSSKVEVHERLIENIQTERYRTK